MKPQLRPDVVLKVLTKNEDPPSSEWADWAGKIAPGHFFADDLAQVRLQLHVEGVCPKVQLSGVGSLKALRIRDTVIHRRPPEADVCEVFATAFERKHKRPLVYRGESLAVFANRAFQELCRPPARKQLTETQRDCLWERQGRACNLCGSPSVQGTTVDHVQPRFVGGNDDLASNLQIICTPCHASKTSWESMSYIEDERPLVSRFSLETYAAFVESPKPPQLVADVHERDDDAISIDVIRCRYNAFVEQDAYDLPIFCPADDVIPTTSPELGDFHWVDIGPLDGRRTPLRAALLRPCLVRSRHRGLPA